MKKKILALLSAAAMTVTALAVPFTASAEEVFADVKTVFSSDENTEWILHEQYGKMSAKVGEITLDSKNDKATGDSITLTIPETYKGESNGSYKPIQVRPNIGSTIALENGVTYDFTVSYTANIYSYSDGTSKDNAVYAAFISRDSDSKEAGAAKDQYGVKVYDEDNKTSSGKITGHFTPTKDNCSLEIQLYLRHAYGSVTFSNLEVTTTSVPEEAVASFTNNGETRYFTDLAEAVKAAGNNSTIEVLDDTTLSERVLLNNSKNGFGGIKNLTINGNGHTISAPAGQNMAFEVPNLGSCVLTINNATIGSGSAQAINVRSGGTLNLNNVTVNSTALRVESAKVNAKDSTINSVLFYSPTSSTKIDLDSNSYINGTIKIDGTAPTGALTLITGTTANCRATVEGDYEINNGVISPKPTTPTGTITMTATYKGSYKGDDNSTAAAYTAKFTTDSEDQMSFNTQDVKWTLGGTSLKLSEASSNGTQIFVTKGFEVTYGIIINGVFYDAETPAETLSVSFN